MSNSFLKNGYSVLFLSVSSSKRIIGMNNACEMICDSVTQFFRYPVDVLSSMMQYGLLGGFFEVSLKREPYDMLWLL